MTSQTIILTCTITKREIAPDGTETLFLTTPDLSSDLEVTLIPLGQDIKQGPGILPSMLNRLDAYHWPPRVKDFLDTEQIVYLGDLCQLSLAYLSAQPSIGPKTIALMATLLTEAGVSFGMDIPAWDDLKRRLCA